MQIERCKETVYGKLLARNCCLRVYSGIVGDESREKGKDAIRVALFGRDENGNVALLSGSKRVNRVGSWKCNLGNRINDFLSSHYEIKECPKCSSIMGLRTSKRTKKQFWGCSQYPKCDGTLWA